jgi:hypothetical protein
MPLGIQRNILDFEILEVGNPNTIVFVDSSQYMEPPDRPLLEVILPGYTKYVLTNVIPNQVNTYNSNTLNLSQSLGINHLTILPDGVWQFKYKICPYDYVYLYKNHLRTVLINEKIDKAYNDLELLGCTDKTTEYILNQIAQVHILLRGAKAAVNVDTKVAGKYYQTANSIIDEVLNKFCKNCHQWGAPPVGR